MRGLALACLAALLAAALLPCAAHPQWTFNGIPLTRAAGAQSAARLVTDGSGGAYALWRDDRTAAEETATQRVDAGGALAPGWPADGLLLATGTGVCGPSSIVADGGTGAFVAWASGVGDPPCGIHVRRLLAAGALAPGALPPFDSLGAASRPLLARSTAGTVFVTWGHASGAGYEVRTLRLEFDGSVTPGWPADGLSLDRGSRSEFPQGIVAEISGGALILSAAFAGDREDLFLHHVTAAGLAAPGFPDSGVLVQRGAGQSQEYAIASDADGGAIVSWWRNTGGAGSADIFAQRITGAGAVAPGWPAGGVVVCGAPGDQANPMMVADGAGGAVIAWLDLDSYDIFAQRITATGQRAPGWTADGVPVCTASGLQGPQVLAPDGAGGVVVAWMDGRKGEYQDRDIYAQRLTGSGAVAPDWPAGGLAVCDDPADQVEPAIVAAGGAPGGAGSGAIIAWKDYRNFAATDLDVYAAAVTASGTVRSDARSMIYLLPPRPNPGSCHIRIDLDVADRVVTSVWLDIVDLAGRSVRQVYSGRPGPGRLTRWWDGHDDDGRAVRPGLYFVYAHATQDMGGTARQSQRIVVVR